MSGKRNLFYKACTVALAVCMTMAALTGCGDARNAEQNGAQGAASGGTQDASDGKQQTAETILETADMFTDRDLSGEYKESEGVEILFEGDGARCAAKGVSVSGSTVTITEEGVYILSGVLNDGMIVIEAEDSAKVQLVFKGVTVTNSKNAAVYVKSADKVFVTLAENTVNTLENGGSYTDMDGNSIDGVIFAKSDLTVNGSGSLNIHAAAGHGIVTKDDLKIADGNITVTAEKHGLCGKDSVRIAGGSITVVSGKDGIHTDNTSDSEKGYIYVAGGELTITASGDGISAEGSLQIDGGSFRITAGGGSGNSVVAKDENGDEVSTKGIKAAGAFVINDGSFETDTQDDALHTDGDLTVNGGSFLIATGDDGLHADGTATVAGGNLVITESYEGIEGKDVVISGGIIDIRATDDGVNAAGGDGQSGGFGGGMFGGFGGAGSGGDYSILISGGSLSVDADGDGLDSNGTLTVTGGAVCVDGPVNSANGAIDYEGVGQITGGTVIALGASGMAMNFGDTSTQGSILLNIGNQPAGTEIVLKTEEGKELLRYTSRKAFGSVAVSCPELVKGGVYILSVGDSDTEITLDSLIYGSGGGFGGFGGDRGGRGGHEGWQQMPEGEPPQMPEGEGRPQMPDEEGRPQMPNEEGGPQMPNEEGRPQMPDGEGRPQMPEGEGRPQMPDGQRSE